jgi:hypothetical protein
LKLVAIPRYIKGNNETRELHTFCDASQDAYAAVSFIRSVSAEGRVTVSMIMARSRLAPIKRPSIPRLELLACVIGARLAHFIIETLGFRRSQSFMWSDSTTALAWIQNNDEWGTFVGNRVEEICQLTQEMTWRHVPGTDNPADLPSRGCSPSQLVHSKWWEGPVWLYKVAEDWPAEEAFVDEETVKTELRRAPAKTSDHKVATTTCSSLLSHQTVTDQPWYLRSFNYQKIVRTMAWVLRFIVNCKKVPNEQGS